MFAYLALAAQLPLVVDIYAYGGGPRLLFVPSYLLIAVFYAVVDPLEPFLAPDSTVGWLQFVGGPLVTYYLFAAALTLIGRRLGAVGSPSVKLDAHNTN